MLREESDKKRINIADLLRNFFSHSLQKGIKTAHESTIIKCKLVLSRINNTEMILTVKANLTKKNFKR